MLRKISALCTVAVLLISVLQADDARKKVENFTLEDCNGVKHSLVDFKSSKAIVLMFIATQCPVSNAYNVRMVELQKDYSSRGVAFVGINSNKQ